MSHLLARVAVRISGSGRDLAPAVRRAQLEFLYRRAGSVRVLVAVPFATVLGMLCLRPGAALSVPLWVVLVCGLTGFTFLAWRRDERRSLPDAEVDAALARRVRHMLAHGVAWGLAPWMLVPQRQTGDLVVTFMLAAISIVSAMLASHRPTVAAFALPASAGLVLAGLASGGRSSLLALPLALYLALLLRWTFEHCDLLVDSLQARFEKEDLARRLAQQVTLVEQATQEKTRFLAAASHDLRQPLHAISLFTGALEHTPLEAATARTVAGLAHSVRMLGNTVDALLDISQLDAGVLRPQVGPVPLRDLLLALHASCLARAESKGLQLRVRADPGLVAASDALWLERLLANLVDNAIKYTEAGGVLVAARRDRQAGRLRLEVVDTGIGIDPAHQQRVFEEFFQAGNPQRDRAAGLGIGLAIVRRLAALLRHDVQLRSRPGRGTRVSVQMPQWHGPEAMTGSARAPQATIQPLGLHVLVLDDEEDNRRALAALLGAWGCTLREAQDAPTARRMVQHEAFDAVLADDRLPGESGLELLLHLRAQAPGLRAWLVTGETAPERVAAIVASGVPWLAKPVRPLDLLAALRG